MNDAAGPAPIDIGDHSDLVDGQMRRVADVGHHGIVVCRVKGDLYALTDNCSHADALLSEGKLRGFALICPVHGASFDVRDGSHGSPPAFEGVACYYVDETPGEVSVTLSAPLQRAPDPTTGPRTR